MNLPGSSPGPSLPPSRAISLPLASTMERRGPEVRRLEVDAHAGAELADDEGRLLAAAAVEAARAVQVVPLRLVLAVAVEHLHAVVLAVGDVDPAVVVGGDVVGDVELAGLAAGLAPRHDQLAVGRELVHARVAVAVGDVDLALGRERGVGAAVERLAAHEGRGLAGDADGELDLALGGAATHGVVAVVGAVEGVVGIDGKAVGALEHALAPRAQEVALAVEHDHGVLAAVEDVDAVLAVDGDGADVHELPAVGQLGPVLNHAIAMLATAQHGRHWGPPSCHPGACHRDPPRRTLRRWWMAGSRAQGPG